MSLGRRKIRVDDPSRWIFNRIAAVYDARPGYPEVLIDAVAALAGDRHARVGDLGAGIGHLALPLAARGFDVVAVDPAQAMLDRLAAAALEAALSVRTVHAAAEALPLESASLDLVVVADALHFLDRQLAAHEIERVLTPRGRLALITCDFADTPFMRGVASILEDAAPRRPRAINQAIVQLSAITGIPLFTQLHLVDEIPVDHATLDRILRSISFVGPAMKPDRFAAFRRRVRALSDTPVWARSFTLRAGTRPRAEPLTRPAPHGSADTSGGRADWAARP